MRRLLGVALLLLLAACAAPRAAESDPPAASAAAPDTYEVDYSCRTNADCEVKNVGNCCGYYPACVNRDSPTFPEQVKAQCAKQGISSICGFPAISECRCQEQRCQAVTGGLSPPAELQ